MARFFKKLYSSIKETVDDDFVDFGEEKNVGDNVHLKVISTLKTSSGVTIKTTGAALPDGKNVEGTLEPEFKIADYDLTLKGKLVTTNTFEGSLLLNDKLLQGSTLFATGKAEGEKRTIEVGFDYLNKENGSLNLKFITPPTTEMKELDLYAAAVGHYNGTSLGGDVRLNLSSNELKLWDVYAEYDNKDVQIAGFAKYDKKKSKKSYGFGYSHNVNENIRGAVEYSYNAVAGEGNLKFGTAYKVDSNTTLKSRFTLQGSKAMRFGFVVKQNINPTTKVTLITDINANRLYDNDERESAGHQFGVTLSFFD